jgi:hypothetical protein
MNRENGSIYNEYGNRIKHKSETHPNIEKLLTLKAATNRLTEEVEFTTSFIKTNFINNKISHLYQSTSTQTSA